MRSSPSTDPALAPGRLLDLDDPRARDAALTGAKAARLAAARALGLPALPGRVVPVAESAVPLARGRAALADGNSGAARRAVLAGGLDEALVAELGAAEAALGSPLIVRSSSPLEDDPRWSGGFASIGEVRPGELAGAVLSCWSAAFSRDVLERLAALASPLEGVGLALLVQPELDPVCGGTALAGPEGVEIVAIAGHPGPLLAGHRDGVRTLVRPDAPAEALDGLLAAERLAEVARLATTVRDRLGAELIEWAVQDGAPLLLQCQPLPPGPAQPPHRSAAGREPLPRDPAASGAGPAGAELAAALEAAAGDASRLPAVHDALLAHGVRVPGTRAVAGDAVGPLVHAVPHADVRGAEGAILVAEWPVPALAPLLAGARGLVTLHGSPHAHLLGVARSLGVPALVGCRVDEVVGELSGLGPGWGAAIDSRSASLALVPGSQT